MGRSLRCGFMLLILSASGALGAAPLEAQWRADVQAGRLQYESAPDAAATSVAFGLTRFGPASEIGVTAGVPFSSEEPIWGALHAFRRIATRDRLRVGIDLAGSGFAYSVASGESLPIFPPQQPAGSVTGWGASLEAMPLLAWTGPRVAAEGRVGAVHFTTSSDGAEAANRTAFVTDASLGATALPDLALRLDGRLVAVTEGTFPYAGVGATWSRGITAWGSLGKWLDGDIPDLSWTAGASVPLGSRFSVVVNGRHDALDPVYATPPRTTWGIGGSMIFGEPPHTVVEPVPASYSDGIATIMVRARPNDAALSIAGDFNDWTPTPMTRRGGAWSYEVALGPGVYNYAFVDQAGEWFVPEGTPGRRDDGMGGHVAVLVVEE